MTNSVLYPCYVLDERAIKERLGDTAKVRPVTRSDARSVKSSKSSVKSGRSSQASSQVSRSFYTTSTQQSTYVKALEAMLTKERQKRLEIEEKCRNLNL